MERDYTPEALRAIRSRGKKDALSDKLWVSALPGLVTRIGFVDDVDAALAALQTIVAMPLGQ
jgi:hypothetical protein